MAGMNAQTGRSLAGIEHLQQSVRDILTTPIGSRVMRREYGSRLWALVDAPLNATTITEIYAAVAEALERWEPRLRLARVQVVGANAGGGLRLNLEGEYRPEGEPVRLEGILVS